MQSAIVSLFDDTKLNKKTNIHQSADPSQLAMSEVYQTSQLGVSTAQSLQESQLENIRDTTLNLGKA